MFVLRRSSIAPAVPVLLAVALIAVASSPSFAAAGRLERPVTDTALSAPAAPAIAPRPPLVFAPQGGPRVLDPANPMREIAPGVYEGIVPFQLADGMWRIDLDERFLLFSVARRADDGGLTHSCVGGLDGLAHWQGAAACNHAPIVPTASPATTVQPKVTTPTGTIRTQWEAQ